MEVAVLGGSGFVGTALCRELADRGHAVAAVARTPRDDGVPEGVRAVAGDVTDPASVGAAVEGSDAVVNLIALSPLFTPAGGNEAHELVHVGGTENAVRAAADVGVDRFVQVSALGADPEGPTAYIRAKGRAETVVRETGLDAVVVRPSVVFGDSGEFLPFTRLLTTPYVTGLPGGGRTRFQPIWVGDVAAVLADACLDPPDAGAATVPTYAVGGPEVLTLADVTRLVYRSDGRPVRVLPVPMWLARIGLTLGGLLPGFPMGPDQYRSLSFDNTVEDNDVTAFGRAPPELRTLADYLDVPPLESRGRSTDAATGETA